MIWKIIWISIWRFYIPYKFLKAIEINRGDLWFVCFVERKKYFFMVFPQKAVPDTISCFGVSQHTCTIIPYPKDPATWPEHLKSRGWTGTKSYLSFIDIAPWSELTNVEFDMLFASCDSYGWKIHNLLSCSIRSGLQHNFTSWQMFKW